MAVVLLIIWVGGLGGLRYTMHPKQEIIDLYADLVMIASNIDLREVGYVGSIIMVIMFVNVAIETSRKTISS